MKRNKIITTGLGLLIAVTGLAGLTACSSGSGSKGTQTAVTAPSTVDVATDLQTGRQAVLDALAKQDWPQVMLASDVTVPTMKYGLMVMPFAHTGAAKRVTGTVTINGGKFVIQAVSAATGQTWQIDQDGNISKATA